MSRHMRTYVARCLGAVAMLSVFGSPLAAQPTRSRLQDSVPRGLAEALAAPQFQMLAMLGLSDGGRPRVIVAALPSSLAGRLFIPPGAMLLGGAESSAGGVAIIRSSLPKDSLAAMYKREQPRRGWSRPPERRFAPTSGFAPAPGSSDDPSDPLIFCAGATALFVGITPVDGMQEISAQATGLGRGLCDPPRPEPVEHYSGRRNYPTLINPPGTGRGPGNDCVRWNSRGGGGSTSLSTSMPVDQIFAHYGKQLADSGWTPVTDQQLVARYWTRRDSTGAFRELTLTARLRAETPQCVELEMEMNGMNPP